MTELEQYATEDAAGNDRGKWPYVVGVEERIAAGAAQRVALDRGNPGVVDADDLDDVATVYCRDGVRGWELARALESVGWSRSQPAPRTVSAEEIREAVSEVNRGEWSEDETAYQVEFLAALGITVEAPRG